MEERKCYTVLEFAKLMRISDAMAYRLVRDGRVRNVRVGDRYILPATVIDDILSGKVKIDSKAGCA